MRSMLLLLLLRNRLQLTVVCAHRRRGMRVLPPWPWPSIVNSFQRLYFHLLHARLYCLSNKRTLKFTRLVHPFFVHMYRCLCACVCECVHFVRALCQVFNSFRQKIYLQYVCAFDAVELFISSLFLEAIDHRRSAGHIFLWITELLRRLTQFVAVRIATRLINFTFTDHWS